MILSFSDISLINLLFNWFNILFLLFNSSTRELSFKSILFNNSKISLKLLLSSDFFESNCSILLLYVF